jgi:hypothetical protein
MSEAILTPEELSALVEASGTGSIGSIAAIEARLFHEISLSASESAKYLCMLAAALGGTPTKPFGISVTVDPTSIQSIATLVINVLQPQISENAHNIRVHNDRLEKAIAEIGLQEIRTELIELIETQWGERCSQLAAEHADLISRLEACERTVQQQTEPPSGGGELSTQRRRRSEPSS